MDTYDNGSSKTMEWKMKKKSIIILYMVLDIIRVLTGLGLITYGAFIKEHIIILIGAFLLGSINKIGETLNILKGIN